MHHIFLVGGFQCQPLPFHVQGVHFHYYCDAHKLQVAGEIAMQCFKRNDHDNRYVRRVYRKVLECLRDPKTKGVHMIGHSYGGFVCSEIALKLTRHPRRSLVHIETYGSIHIIDNREKCPDIDMVQYMFKGDLSLWCTDAKHCVKWLRHKKVHNVLDSYQTHRSYPVFHRAQQLIKEYGGSVTNERPLHQTP